MSNITSKYKYEVYEVEKTYKKIAEGSLNDICELMNFNPQSMYQAYVMGNELYGKYLIKRRKFNNDCK